jgi:hypothetical protein
MSSRTDLAAANPLSKIDEKSDMPPQAQMTIATLQKQLQEAQQLLQQAGMEIKFKQGIEKMKQDGETKRELIQTWAMHTSGKLPLLKSATIPRPSL